MGHGGAGSTGDQGGAGGSRPPVFIDKASLAVTRELGTQGIQELGLTSVAVTKELGEHEI